MPGVDLNLSLPELADTMATIVAKTAVALSAIEDDLAGLITPSEMDINADLDFAGNGLSGVRGLVLTDGYDTAPPGTIHYSDDEFYVVTEDGEIRLTLDGLIDVSSVGGISGMGGNNSSVVFDLASGEFRFFQDTGVPADLVAGDVVLTGDNGTVRLTVHDQITVAREIIVKSLPTTGVSLLAYKGSTSTLEDAATLPITADLDFSGTIGIGALEVVGYTTVGTSLEVGGVLIVHGATTLEAVEADSLNVTGDADVTTIDASVDYKHSFAYTRRIDGLGGEIAAQSPSFASLTQSTAGLVFTNLAVDVYTTWRKALGLKVGDKLTDLTVNVTKAGAGVGDAALALYTSDGALLQTATNISGAGTYDLSVGLAIAALASPNDYYFDLTGVGGTHTINYITLSWTRR
jgi:hypothetical protein